MKTRENKMQDVHYSNKKDIRRNVR